MKNLILAFIISVVCLTSCDKKEVQPLTRQEMKQIVDSITAARIKEVDARAQKDLEYRLKIEVKVTADSIMNAKMKQQAKDTAAPKQKVISK